MRLIDFYSKFDILTNCYFVRLGQLILPECMKLLPLYTNCLIESDALSGGSDMGCDDRAFAMSAVSSKFSQEFA